MNERLTDEEIDAIQEHAYRALRASGYNGGMGGETWDRASARAIESAVLARAAVPAVQPPEFQEVSWGVTSTMRDCKGMAVSEYAFRQWAESNGIALAAPQARQEPKPDSVYLTSSSGEAATARDAARYRFIRTALLSGGPEWDKLAAMLNIAPDTPTGVDDAVDVALSSTPAQGDGGTGAGVSVVRTDLEWLRLPEILAKFTEYAQEPTDANALRIIRAVAERTSGVSGTHETKEG